MFRSNRNQLSRRTFLHGGVVAGGALAALTALPKHQARAAENLELQPRSVVLFQGDSITDAGRNRNSTAAKQVADEVEAVFIPPWPATR